MRQIRAFKKGFSDLLQEKCRTDVCDNTQIEPKKNKKEAKKY